MIETYIKETLLKRRQTAEKTADKNLKTALQDEEFKQLYSSFKALEIEKAKSQVYNKTFDEKKLENLKNKLKTKLNELNLTFNSLIPKYTCPLCEDTGIYQNKECSCINKIKSFYLLKKCGLNFVPHTFKDCNFSIFDNPELIKNFYEKMKNWCVQPTTIKNIVISGKSGVGKSFLLECMLSELIKEKQYVVYTTAFSLSQNLLKYHTTFDKIKEEIISPYLNCDVLIIDDLGSEPIFKNVTEEYLYLILNQRIFEHKSVIISTNLTLQEIQNRYGERIFSRIISKNFSKIFNIENSDLRLKNNKK